MFRCFLDLVNPRPPPPSVKDLEDIENLDALLKALYNRRHLVAIQLESVRMEAIALGIDPHKFWLPPPPGVSQQLHDWMVEVADLIKMAGRLKRLAALKAQLPPSRAGGSTETSLPAAISSEELTPSIRRRHVVQPDEQLTSLLSPPRPAATSRG